MEQKKLFLTSISGINFNATSDDIGPIIGYIEPDPENEYDERAIKVCRVNGERIGYVPSKSLDDFYAFRGEGFEKMVYVGNIKSINRGEDKYLVGNIAIIRSEDESEVSEFIDKFMFDPNFNMYGQTKQL